MEGKKTHFNLLIATDTSNSFAPSFFQRSCLFWPGGLSAASISGVDTGYRAVQIVAAGPGKGNVKKDKKVSIETVVNMRGNQYSEIGNQW